MKTLEINALSKRYGERLALDSLSFTVPPGEIFGFVGSNGAGKTTTMRIAVGVLRADEGDVRYGGAPVDVHTSARFGYMPEERGLYPKMTVAKHLVYLGRLHGLSTKDARAAMLRWTERLHLSERRDSAIDALSLGNRQRVQLAAALVHDPDVLILDEPFSGLDPLAVQDMAQVIKEKAADGAPVLFSSHQLDLVERLCDRVGVVREGRLAACGSLDVLHSAGPARLFLQVDGARADWPDRCAAVAAYEAHEDGILVELAAGHDENDLLRAAVDQGRVRRMAWQRPTLTEMFRDLIEPAEPAEGAVR
ncbi:ATP-binding cassette domain-containing protein [Streptomyces sp. ISL-43]|uniref:ABC transporter ATP-binding protein n=1 Tax=Streptomyces sp. ISL-43 TaxID=2819183 RepID=UPI001BEA83A6|nr:ATP-binding cassette domain-containing protein [Streptomyces sp. ISL-43]MBT2446162.1 ATP-binding cassette domain-containing protein [Streptomyces sp. ISL-43]